MFEDRPWAGRTQAAAIWNLRIGAGAMALTVLFGFVAFDSALVDDPDILKAMAAHRNWAWATAVVFLVITGWSIVSPLGAGRLLFLAVLLVGTTLLAVTGWKGGTLVHKHGVGVERVEALEGDERVRASNSIGRRDLHRAGDERAQDRAAEPNASDH